MRLGFESLFGVGGKRPLHGLLSFASITIWSNVTALMRIPKRKPVVIEVPYPQCEVSNCDGVRQFDIVVLFLNESKLELFQICGVHAFLWKGFVSANFFPLNSAPSLEWIAHQVELEIKRRNPPRPMYYSNVTSYGTSTGNMTGGFMNFRFR